MTTPIRIEPEHTYRISRTRSGTPIYDHEDLPGNAVLALLGDFVSACIVQRGELPELTTPPEFQSAMLRFEFTGLHGPDADRPWHVLDIERYSELRVP